MHTLTPKQYLVEISLKTLTCQPTNKISKVFCELHCGQSYVEFKYHPLIDAKGIANFEKQTICVPYCDQIALVFKRKFSSKNQLFLGHHQIQIQDYLQRKIYFIELNEKLEETQTYINFECKIIDRNRFAESETEELSQGEQSGMQKSQYSTFDGEPINLRLHQVRESQSEYNSGRRSPRSAQSPYQQRPSQKFIKQLFTPLVPQEFSKQLGLVEEILKKKRLIESQPQKISGFRRNKGGELKSQKIESLERLLNNKKQEQVFNSMMVNVVVGLLGVFMGMVLFS